MTLLAMFTSEECGNGATGCIHGGGHPVVFIAIVIVGIAIIPTVLLLSQWRRTRGEVAGGRERDADSGTRHPAGESSDT